MKKSVSQETVNTVADELRTELGKIPTLAAVRTRISRGSFSTLAPMLAEWRDSQPQHIKNPNEPPEPPEPVVDGFQRLWRVAYKTAQTFADDARKALEAYKKEIETERKDWARENERLETANNDLNKELEVANSKIASLTDENNLVKQAVSKLEGENRILSNMTNDQKNKIDEQMNEISSLKIKLAQLETTKPSARKRTTARKDQSEKTNSNSS